MEAGKKYLNKNSNLKYECVCVLPSGNAVITNGLENEWVIPITNFKNYQEIKEKKKAYVFLFRMKKSDWSSCFHNSKENAMGSRNWCLEHGRDVSEIKEVEFDV